MSLFRIEDDRISTLKHSANGNAFSCRKSELPGAVGTSRYRDRAIFIAIYPAISCGQIVFSNLPFSHLYPNSTFSPAFRFVRTHAYTHARSLIFPLATTFHRISSRDVRAFFLAGEKGTGAEGRKVGKKIRKTDTSWKHEPFKLIRV